MYIYIYIYTHILCFFYIYIRKIPVIENGDPLIFFLNSTSVHRSWQKTLGGIVKSVLSHESDPGRGPTELSAEDVSHPGMPWCRHSLVRLPSGESHSW